MIQTPHVECNRLQAATVQRCRALTMGVNTVDTLVHTVPQNSQHGVHRCTPSKERLADELAQVSQWPVSVTTGPEPSLLAPPGTQSPPPPRVTCVNPYPNLPLITIRNKHCTKASRPSYARGSTERTHEAVWPSLDAHAGIEACVLTLDSACQGACSAGDSVRRGGFCTTAVICTPMNGVKAFATGQQGKPATT